MTTELTFEELLQAYRDAAQRERAAIRAWRHEHDETGQLNGPAYQPMQDARKETNRSFSAVLHHPGALNPAIGLALPEKHRT